MKRIVFSVSYILLTVFGSFAQNAFVNYTDASGLPDNNVMGVAVDGNNELWFATQEGVAHFNGTAWAVYNTSHGLPDNYVTCIAASPNGDIWAGTDNGVCRFNRVQWVNFAANDGLVDDMVKYIAVEQTTGIVWIGTPSGVSRYDGTTFSSITTANGLPSPLVSYIGVDQQNIKWFCTWMGGVVRYDGTAMLVINQSDGILDDNITSITFDTLGNKYLGTYYGISVLNAQNAWIGNITYAQGLYHDVIQDVAIDSKGRLYAGIFVDYLVEGGISGITTGGIYSYSTGQGLVSPFVNRLTADHDDNIWIATGNGVSMFKGEYLSVPHQASAGFNIKIWPNPAVEEVNIECDLSGIVTLRITDMSGRCVSSADLVNGTGKISAAELTPGLYLLEVFRHDGMSAREKIIISR
jgi:ligand-binding sensor domain-containing protein